MSAKDTERIPRPQADRREGLINPDSKLMAQMYFDVERRHTVVVQAQSGPEKWNVHHAATGEYLGEIWKGMKRARMEPGGRYINLSDVPDEVRTMETMTGICPTCKREPATEDPEREMTVFSSPNRAEGWAECDQGRGHRYPITEVLLRVE